MAFTYFFRDLQTLEMICQYALPNLKSRRYINIWDAGCAMGPEPFKKPGMGERKELSGTKPKISLGDRNFGKY